MDMELIITLIALGLAASGAAVRPVVTFSPEWNKIFEGESITMTCNVESTERGDPTITWYKDNSWLHAGKTYRIQQAQESHSGSYQCQADNSDRSDSARLEVYNRYVILQTPLHVYEGDDVRLRCHHYPGYTAGQTVFYKDQDVVQNWGSEPELLVENVNVTSNWKYKCTKQVRHHLLYYHHSGEAVISFQELFPPPVLKLAESDGMTLICDTRISPLRETTELQFAFYRDGQDVQEYSASDRYIIPPNWREISGTYKCQVRTSTNTVEKTSETLTTGARIKELFPPPVLRLAESDDMTLICDTRISPLRKTTELQFAFYRDSQEVQEYSASDRYIIPPDRREISGTYKCQVRTSSNTVVQTSETLTTGARIKDPHNAVPALSVTCVVLVVLLLVVVGVALYREGRIRLPFSKQQLKTDPPELSDLEPLMTEEHEENAYFGVI